MRGSAAHPVRFDRRGRLRAVDALTLAAVGLVVLLVSLPRLRDLALRENEADAVWLTRRLAELSCARSGARVEELVVATPALRRQVDDAEFLQGGRLLRRHGYVFEVLEMAGEGGPRSAVRAWPWQAGKTGRIALLWTAERGLVGDTNDDLRWSASNPPGPENALLADWRPVRER